MLFITHGMPRALKVDEVIQLGKGGAQTMHVVPTAAGASLSSATKDAAAPTASARDLKTSFNTQEVSA